MLVRVKQRSLLVLILCEYAYCYVYKYSNIPLSQVQLRQIYTRGLR